MFVERLHALIRQFDKDKATQLSLEIHRAERNGYQVSDLEDKLWGKLTTLLMLID